MKRFASCFKLKQLSVMILVWLLAASASFATVSKRIRFTLASGEKPTVTVLHYGPRLNESYHHVIAKYADLANRAAEYKKANPNETVDLKFSIYKLSNVIYVGFNPAAASYNRVNGRDFDGDNTEKLVYSIVKAAKAGVNVKLIYHNPADELDEVGTYIGKKVPHRRITWGASSSQQMHNKFMIVRYTKKGRVATSQVYTTTSNGDKFSTNFLPNFNAAQTGVLVENHHALYDAYSKYFDVIWKYYNDQAKFQKQVRSLHLKNQLNYRDEHFRAYFFPVPTKNFEPGDDYKIGWSHNYNPITELVNALAARNESRYVKMSIYTFGSGNDAFANRMSSEIATLHRKQRKLLHVRSVVNNLSSAGRSPVPLPPLDGQTTHEYAPTHEKNITFAFSGSKEYYSIVGSANFKTNEFTRKANNMLMIIEKTTAHPVYNALKDAFYSTY